MKTPEEVFAQIVEILKENKCDLDISINVKRNNDVK